MSINREELAKQTKWISFAIKRISSVCNQLPKDILHEVSYFGFAIAVCKWNGKGCFSTYAVYCIQHAIQDHLRQELHNHGYANHGRMPKRSYTHSNHYDSIMQKYHRIRHRSKLDAFSFKKSLIIDCQDFGPGMLDV